MGPAEGALPAVAGNIVVAQPPDIGRSGIDPGRPNPWYPPSPGPRTVPRAYAEIPGPQALCGMSGMLSG